MISKPTDSASPAAAKALRRRRLIRWGLAALAVYAVVGFFIVPPIIKWQLREQLPCYTQRRAEVKQVRVNPFALSLTIRGLELKEADGTTFAGFDEFYGNFQLSSLFRWAWTFDEVRLVHPVAHAIRRADGSFNFANLGPTNGPANLGFQKPPPALIHLLEVTNAVVKITDETLPEPFRAAYGPMHVHLTEFSTRHQEDGPYQIVATTDQGEAFGWSGRVAVNPLRSHGEFKLTGIPPTKYAPYLAQFSSVKVLDGALDVGATYHANFAAVPLELDVTNAMVELRHFLVKPPVGEEKLVALDKLRVAHASASLTGQVARVELVSVEGGSLFLKRETNGLPAALSYVTLPTNALATGSAGGSALLDLSAWRFDLNELSVRDFAVTVQDHAADGVAELGLENVAMKLTGASSVSNSPIQLSASFNWRGGGAVATESRGTLLPPVLTNQVTVSNLALAPLQPYVGQFLNVVLHSGELNVHGVATADPAANPMLRFAGAVSVTDFSASDTIAYKEIAAWDNLVIRDIAAEVLSNRAEIAEVKFTGARFTVGRNSNEVVNLVALVKQPPGATNAAAFDINNAAAATAGIPPLRIGALLLESSSLRATDDSLLRPFELVVESFDAAIRDIRLPGLNKAEVEVRGRFGSGAPFEVVGPIVPDPQNLFADLKIALTNADLTVFSPIAEKFVGRPLTKGKVTTELRYRVENRRLNGANLVGLEKLTFGGRVPSPAATKLPVKLAVGLLKDSDGNIHLDVPVTGSLDAPGFSIRGVVLDALQTVILKVATSPFSLLGSLVGSGAELQYVDFSPGVVLIPEGETNKMVQLAAALAKRPALELEIGATYDPVQDVDRIGRRKLLERLKRQRLEELVARKKSVPAFKDFVLPDEDYDRMLRLAYRNAFNTTPEDALREAYLTAAAEAAGTNRVATPGPTMRPDAQRGATQLARRDKSLAELMAAAAPDQKNPAGVTAAPALTEQELVRNELERRLATLAPPTDDELRALMQQRIEAVHKFLIETAGVPAERIGLSSSDPKAPQSQATARVVFSLE